ncbi:MAG TPA: hypothetical protein VHD32_12330 [Candidatus Didemnitutus sp.]|nr:hypothetical protein [Candidatus Didemnitutus sp.]
MLRPSLALISAVLLAACAGTRTAPPDTPWTLRRNPRLPTDEIAQFYEPEKFVHVLDEKYAGYVILEGEAPDNRSVRVDRVAEAFPDHSLDVLARGLVANARVSGHQVGSHLAPRVEVFVVFYATKAGTLGALVYGRELPAAESRTQYKSLFMKVVDDANTALTPNGPGATKLEPNPPGGN